MAGVEKELVVPVEKFGPKLVEVLREKCEELEKEIDKKHRYLFTLDKIEILDKTVIEICELIKKKVYETENIGFSEMQIEGMKALSGAIEAISGYRRQMFSVEKSR